jgi:hypothetical protein
MIFSKMRRSTNNMKQYRTPDRTPATGHLRSQVQQYGPERASLPASLIECAAVYGPDGSTRGAAAQTPVQCAGVHFCQTTGSRIEIETWSKEGRPCSPPMHRAVQGQQTQHTQSLGADHRWRCTLQARRTGTRRRCGAEVNHVAASLSTEASGTLAADVAVT